MKKILLFGLVLGLVVGSATKAPADPTRTIVRVGHFPNITHAQGVIGHATGQFDKKLEESAKIDWKVFSAGPSVIEAIFAGELDIAYVGPSPAVNGFVKSQGDALRVVAGAASGGAALVVRADAGIETSSDLEDRKVASPQLGNTQDVALRSWLLKNGLKLKENGGNVQVVPLANADQLTLFIKKEIDGAWTVEPWVSLLVANGGGKVFLDESSLWPDGKYATTLLVVRRKFLEENPLIIKKFLETHVEITARILANPEEAKKTLNEEIEKLTRKMLPQEVLDAAFGRVRFTNDPLSGSVEKQAEAAFQAGFLKKKPDLSGLFDLELLSEVLGEKKLEPVS